MRLRVARKVAKQLHASPHDGVTVARAIARCNKSEAFRRSVVREYLRAAWREDWERFVKSHRNPQFHTRENFVSWRKSHYGPYQQRPTQRVRQWAAMYGMSLGALALTPRQRQQVA